MKFFLIFILFLSSLIFASYDYKKSGKIDMHGGKGDSILNNQNTFSSKNTFSSIKLYPKKIQIQKDKKSKSKNIKKSRKYQNKISTFKKP